MAVTKITQIQMLRCTVGGLSFCIDSSKVKTVVPVRDLWRNTLSEEPLGWVRYEEVDVAVYSLGNRLNTRKGGVNSQGSVIVLEHLPMRWGLAVDEVNESFEVASDQVFPLPAIALPPAGKPTLIEEVVVLDETPGESLQVRDSKFSTVLHIDPERLHPSTPQQQPVRPLNYARLGPRPAVFPAPAQAHILAFKLFNPDPHLVPLLFGLSLTQVLEIRRIPRLTPVPGPGPHVLGMINWRDRPVCVVDLGLMLGLAPIKFELVTRLLVARGSKTAQIVGIPVTADLRGGSLPIPHQPCHRALPLEQRYVRGMFELDPEVLVVPDLDALLARR